MLNRRVYKVTDLRWYDVPNRLINCNLWYADDPNTPEPFTLHGFDCEAVGRIMYNRAIAGDFGPIKQKEI